jgi:hypothetical protein
MAQSPCFTPLANSLFTSLSTPFHLLGNPPLRDRILFHLGPRFLVNYPPFSQPLPIPSPFQIPGISSQISPTSRANKDVDSTPASRVRNKYCTKRKTACPTLLVTLFSVLLTSTHCFNIAYSHYRTAPLSYHLIGPLAYFGGPTATQRRHPPSSYPSEGLPTVLPVSESIFRPLHEKNSANFGKSSANFP